MWRRYWIHTFTQGKYSQVSTKQAGWVKRAGINKTEYNKGLSMGKSGNISWKYLNFQIVDQAGLLNRDLRVNWYQVPIIRAGQVKRSGWKIFEIVKEGVKRAGKLFLVNC